VDHRTTFVNILYMNKADDERIPEVFMFSAAHLTGLGALWHALPFPGANADQKHID
jgi:hypothetical protein